MQIFQKNLDFADKAQIIITYFIRVTLLIAIAGALINQRWTILFASSLILFLTFLPNFIERKYRIFLPIEFELIIIIFIYASLFLGEMHGYYTKFWWWDIALHTSSGLALGFAGFIILYTLYYKDKIKANPAWIVVFSFCFGVAIGAVWEIFEFAMDQLLGINMQKSGLIDTMRDLIVDSVGALLVSLIGYFYIKGKKTPLFNRLLDKFRNENPKLS